MAATHISRRKQFIYQSKLCIFFPISNLRINKKRQLLKAPFVKTFHIIKSQTGSNDLEGCEVRTNVVPPTLTHPLLPLYTTYRLPTILCVRSERAHQTND